MEGMREAGGFYDLACRFRQTVTGSPEAGAVLGALLALYAAAMDLPEGAGIGQEAPELPPVRPCDFGEWDLYWMVCDPYRQEEPVCGSLQDDLRDICQGLAAGVWLYEHGDAAGALEQWRMEFRNTWRFDAADAIRALNALL